MDQRDQQVKGLDRYIPSKIAKTLLVSLVTTSILTIYVYLSGDQDIIYNVFGKAKIDISKTALVWVLLLNSIALIVELAVIINHSKHSRITHYSFQFPSMTFRWLWENSGTKHYLFVILVFVLGLISGVCIENL
ncbi:hypothetical protein [Agaribacterium sp. ZY112]|uniref:hypothetical protein n=1 Tax=Agaribacterium sp. ZY112 TaxID=3233574 RepID=UPI003523ED68